MSFDIGSAGQVGRFSGRFFEVVSSANDPDWGTAHTFTDSAQGDFYSTGILLINASGNLLEVSFDGTNVHGVVPANATITYDRRIEAQIFIRSASGGDTCYVHAW